MRAFIRKPRSGLNAIRRDHDRCRSSRPVPRCSLRRSYANNRRLLARRCIPVSGAGNATGSGNGCCKRSNPNIGERAGAWALLERLKTSPLSQTTALVRADEGFAGADWEAQVNAHFGWPVEITRKPKKQVGFAVLPRRWVIEQTFGCWGRYRRLSKDDEQHPSCSRAMLLLAAIHRALQYLIPPPSADPPFKTRNP